MHCYPLYNTELHFTESFRPVPPCSSTEFLKVADVKIAYFFSQNSLFFVLCQFGKAGILSYYHTILQSFTCTLVKFFCCIFCVCLCPHFLVRKFWLQFFFFRKSAVPVVSRELAQGIFVVGQAEESCKDRQNIILEEERSSRYLFLFYKNFIFTFCNSSFVVTENSVFLQKTRPCSPSGRRSCQNY